MVFTKTACYTYNPTIWMIIMTVRSIQLALSGFPNVIRVRYEQTKGEKGTAQVYQIEGSNKDRITLHAGSSTPNKHGIFENLSDKQAMSIIKGYENAS